MTAGKMEKEGREAEARLGPNDLILTWKPESDGPKAVRAGLDHTGNETPESEAV